MRFGKRLLSFGLPLIFAFAAFTTPAGAQIPEGQFGVSVGGTFETLDNLDAANTSASFGNEVGFHFGASYEQALGMERPWSALAVRPGVFGRRVGQYSFSNSLEGQGAALLNGRSFTVWAIEFPLDLKYTFPLDGPVSPYALAGPQLSVLRGEEDFQEPLEDVAYSVNLGAGVEIDLPLRLTLMPEFRYELGLSDVFQDNPTYRFRELSVEDSPTIGGLNLRVHLFLQLF